eukprot:4130047-Amphidinium_carterae.3
MSLACKARNAVHPIAIVAPAKLTDLTSKEPTCVPVEFSETKEGVSQRVVLNAWLYQCGAGIVALKQAPPQARFVQHGCPTGIGRCTSP